MPRKGQRPQLSERGLQLVAQRFKVLGEPTRLKLLVALEEGEQNVTTLIELTASRRQTFPSTSRS